jgi:hypothetical protein
MSGAGLNPCVQVDRYRLGLVKRGVSPERAAAFARAQTGYFESMVQVVGCIMAAYDQCGGGKPVDRNGISNMVRRVYGLIRRAERCDWPRLVVQVGGEWLAKGYDEPVVRAAMSSCFQVLGVASMDPVSVERGSMAVEQGKVMMDSEQKVGRVVRRQRRGAVAELRQTPLESFARKRAVDQLTLALARFEPVVKRCVATRLLRHESYARLAKRLELSLDEVREILGMVRPYVSRFTTYFDTDWFWVEGARRTFEPR